jgi:D-alanyl-lipoteichoic acid acyltransferase DltB (MBOAT superfamily)
MEITSLQYLLFVIAFLICFHFLNQRFKKIALLIASYFFYGCFSLILLSALLFSTIVNYTISRSKIKHKTTILICFNIGLLSIFKASNIFSETSILVPIGISFFTFQAIGYVIDVSNNKVTKQHNILDFANFLSFFPQLIAGPIESFNKLGTQLIRFEKVSWVKFQTGLYSISIGLAQKMIIADRCGVVVEEVYSNLSEANFFSFLIATLLFSFQIFLDFSAYCNIAIGISRCLGINLSSNFNSPYLSSSISNFWRNWHITLHLWFKTYVLIYLKQKINWIFAVFSIFVLSGVWHGVSMHYILWGLFSFSTFLIDRFLIQKIINNKYLKTLLTFSLITIGWVLFRINNVDDLDNIPLEINQITLLGINQTALDFYYVITNFTTTNWFGTIMIANQKIPITYLDFLILMISILSWGIISFLKTKICLNNYKTIVTLVLLILVGLFGFTISQPFLYLQF